ncbi:hypothetical protein C8F01DRAFT_1228196 [Mycena amicta]|nr:hypothetical protein C8F01DRAFT_1228196 [Mycena amicta]
MYSNTSSRILLAYSDSRTFKSSPMSTRSRRRTLLAVLLVPIFIYFVSLGLHSILPPSLTRTFDALLDWLGTHFLRILAGTALLLAILLVYGLIRTVFMLCSGSGLEADGESETSAPPSKLKDETRTLLAAVELTQVIELTLPCFLLLLTLCTSYLLLDLWLFDVIHRDQFDESLAQNLLAVATHELHGLLDVCVLAAAYTAFMCCSRCGKRGNAVSMDGLAGDLDTDTEEESVERKVKCVGASDNGRFVENQTSLTVSPESIV